MQSNLHRVSEFSVMAEPTIKDGMDKPEAKTAIKRLREHDSDSESEHDDISVSANMSVMPDNKNQGSLASNFRQDSLKSETTELDTTVFLSFDWENERPYEKAVERYYISPRFGILASWSSYHCILFWHFSFFRNGLYYVFPPSSSCLVLQIENKSIR